MVKVFRKVLAAQSSLNTASAPMDSEGASHLTMYAVFSSGVSAGVVTFETSPDPAFSGTWASLGTASFAANTVVKVAVAECHRYLRGRISTAIVGGTVDVYLACGGALGGPAGNWI